MASELEVASESEPPISAIDLAYDHNLSFPRPPCQGHPCIQRCLHVRFDFAAPACTRAMLTAAYNRWEFFTTLDFEWEVFTGRRPWKWSFAVYFIARLLAMGSTILTFIGFNLTTQFNCNVRGSSIPSFGIHGTNLAQAWFRCTLVCSWFSVAIASFLLVLRRFVLHDQTFPSGMFSANSIH